MSLTRYTGTSQALTMSIVNLAAVAGVALVRPDSAVTFTTVLPLTFFVDPNPEL